MVCGFFGAGDYPGLEISSVITTTALLLDRILPLVHFSSFTVSPFSALRIHTCDPQFLVTSIRGCCTTSTASIHPLRTWTCSGRHLPPLVGRPPGRAVAQQQSSSFLA